MRKIYIICEGQTEAEFVKSILRSYFLENGTIVFPITLSTSQPTNQSYKGGAMSFDRYKKGIVAYLQKKDNCIVTSMIDFYKLSTDFPAYDDSKKITDKYKRVEFLENAIKEEIGKKIDIYRFLPHIQLHEFESILFSDIKGFKVIYKAINIDLNELKEIEDIINEFKNPELINDGNDTAPSKRLIRIIKKYDKVEYGTMIAGKIGIETIMSKCQHFREWIEKLIEMSK